MILRAAAQTLSLTYTKILGAYTLKGFVGSPKQKIILELNMEEDYTWLTNYLFSSEKSKTFRTYQTIPNFEIGNETAELTLSSDSLVVYDNTENVTLKEFIFYYCPDSSNLYNQFESFGFAHTFRNNSFSLVHKFYAQGLIKEEKFGFFPLKATSGIFFLGAPPKKAVENKNNLRWKINPSIKGWNFKLSSVNDIQNNFEALFNSNMVFINAPKDMMRRMIHEFFRHYFAEGICEITHNQITDYIFCKCKDIKNFPNITFVIEGRNVTLDRERLFEKESENCYFLISNSTYINSKRWVFGNGFLQHFTSEFDVKNKEITLYSSEFFEERKVEDGTKYRKIGIMLISILLSINTIYLLEIKIFKLI